MGLYQKIRKSAIGCMGSEQVKIVENVLRDDIEHRKQTRESPVLCFKENRA
jgi:hypothetical protein